MFTKRAPKSTRLRTITVFAPVPEQSLDELTERLHRLRERPSPFAAMPDTHFARLTILPRDAARPEPHPRGMRLSATLIDLLTHAGRAQRPDPPSLSYLLFSASYDGPARSRGQAGPAFDADYVERMRVRLGPVADELWGLCSMYPGHSDPARFRAFFAERVLPPAGYIFSASDEQPTVGQIRRALQLRRQVIDVAVETDGLAEDQLVKQLRQVFGEPGAQAPVPDPGTGGQLPLKLEAEPEPSLVDPAADRERLAHGGRPAPTDPDLADVQNLVTSGYPRHLVFRHLLLRITDPPAARRWLAGAAAAIPTAGWAERYVDRVGGPADDSLPDDPADRPAAPDAAVHLAISYAGLVRLGLPEAELAGFAGEFRAGMAGREPGLTPGRGISTWQPPFAIPGRPEPDGQAPMVAGPGVHLLVMFSGTDDDALQAYLAAHPELGPGERHGLQLLDTIEAGRIPADRPGRADAGDAAGKSGFREHFGFVDGLSQPRIHGVTAGRRTAELPAGEVLLGYRDVDGDTAGAGLPSTLARNGSYLVYRKLEQDVPAFRELTRQLAGRLEAKLENGSEELAAAKLMGRWRDGTPLTLAAEHSNPALTRQPFGFQEHDPQGLRCPVGAHVRRANPRDSRPVDPNSALTDGARAGLETELTMRHRMLRRGIPYGQPLPESDSELAADERGLVFIALVCDIRRQFEFIQAHWMSDGNAFRLGTDRDILSGAALQDTKIVIQGTPPTFLQPAKPVVTCRGGEYFFLPGIRALKRIAAG